MGILLSVDDRSPGAPLAPPNDDHLSSKTIASSTPVDANVPSTSSSSTERPVSRTRSSLSSLYDSIRSLSTHRRSSSREAEHQSPRSISITSRLRAFFADALIPRFAGQVLRIFIVPIMLALILVTCHGASLLGRSCDFALVLDSGGNSPEAINFRYEAWKISDVFISRFLCSIIVRHIVHCTSDFAIRCMQGISSSVPATISTWTA